MLYLDMFVTALLAILSGMGIGSGGLMVLYLTFFRDAPQLHAQGVNLLFFLFASAASMLIHLSRRRIRLFAVALMILSGLPCAALGARLALSLPHALMARLFGIFLILAGSIGLFSKKKQKNRQKS